MRRSVALRRSVPRRRSFLTGMSTLRRSACLRSLPERRSTPLQPDRGFGLFKGFFLYLAILAASYSQIHQQSRSTVAQIGRPRTPAVRRPRNVSKLVSDDGLHGGCSRIRLLMSVNRSCWVKGCMNPRYGSNGFCAVKRATEKFGTEAVVELPRFTVAQDLGRRIRPWWVECAWLEPEGRAGLSLIR